MFAHAALAALCAAAVAGLAAAQPQCTVEQATRVSGNDIGSLNTSTAAECCAACAAKPGCGFYTFVAPKSLCWLKTDGSGGTKHDPDCTSGANLVPPPGWVLLPMPT